MPRKNSQSGFVYVFVMLLVAGLVGVIIAANIQTSKQFVADTNVLGVFTTQGEYEAEQNAPPKLFGLVPISNPVQVGPLKFNTTFLMQFAK